MPAVGRLIGTPASISASDDPHTVAIDDEPFELGDLRDDAQRVGELMVRRQHGPQRAPRQLAVADVAAPWAAKTTRLADGVGREVVMQQERFLVRSRQRVDILLVFAGAERGDDQRLRLAAGEQRRAVGARQHAGLGHDVAHGFQIAPIDAFAGVEDVPADDLGFQFLEHVGHVQLVVLRLRTFREEVREHLGLHGVDRGVALLLDRDRVGRPQFLFGEAEHFLFDRCVVDGLELARFFRRLLGELDDRVDDRLEMPVAEHDRAEHHLFRQLLRLGLDHQHRIVGAGDDQIELGLGHLVQRRVQHEFVVDEAYSGGADRAHERRAGQRQRGGGRHHRQNVRIVFHVMGENGDDHLRLVAPAVGEQRTDRAIDQAGDQRLLFGGAAFALEIATGDAACGVGLFLVVDGQGQKVDAFTRRLRCDDGREHNGLAIGGHDCAICLARYLSCFKFERTSAPIQFHGLNIEHCIFLSSTRENDESHVQDGKMLTSTARS